MTRSTIVALFTLSLTGHAATQTGKPQFEQTRRALTALTAEIPETGYAVGTVDADGNTQILTAGQLDGKLPFEDWAWIPLGTMTRILLDQAIESTEAFSPDDPVGTWLPALAKPIGARSLNQIRRSDEIELPYYFRFVADRSKVRPLDEVLEAHAFPLLRYERSPHPAMLEAAIAQRALERATDRPWAQLLADAGKQFGMAKVLDATLESPQSMLTVGRLLSDQGPGRALKFTLGEVPAFGNAVASLDDVVRFTEACLEAIATKQPNPVRKQVEAAFYESVDESFGISTSTCESRFRNTTLQVELVPSAKVGFFLFSNRERHSAGSSHWLKRLREAAMLDLTGPKPEIVGPEPVLFGGRFIPKGSRWPVGLLRAKVPIDKDHIATVDLRIVKRSSVSVSVDGVASGEIVSSLDYRRIEVYVPLPEHARSGETRQLEFSLSRDAKALVGVSALSRTTDSDILIERLPRPVRFEPVQD